MSNIVVLILAAGSSSRMGSPKQLLKWGTSTLLGHTIDTAKTLNHTEIFVILGANYHAIKLEIEHYPVQILLNEDWEDGLGKSIAFGVDHIINSKSNVDGILIMLADQPLITSAYLGNLTEKFKVGESQIIASSYKNGKQGVPVLFDRVYFEELSKLSDDKGAKALLQKHSEQVSALNAEHIVSDIDSLEDYERLYKANR